MPYDIGKRGSELRGDRPLESLILPGFTRKLSWAEHHLEPLEQEVAAFADSHVPDVLCQITEQGS